MTDDHLKSNQKFEYLNIIEYGINNIGWEMDIAHIREVFEGKTKVVEDDLENIEVWATNHAYLGQDHLCLSFEQDGFYGLIDFDLMPADNSFKPEGQIKRLVNFKAQIFAKNNPYKLPLLNVMVYFALKKRYGASNNFDKFDKKEKKEFIKMDRLLRGQYKSFGANPDEVQIWYIEKRGIYYLASFYYFKGNERISPYLSFAITEMFKFGK